MTIDPKVVTELSKRQVILYPGEDGYWVIECPSLPGCISQGKTEAEALENIKDAIDLWIRDAVSHNEPIPDDPKQIQLMLVAV